MTDTESALYFPKRSPEHIAVRDKLYALYNHILRITGQRPNTLVVSQHDIDVLVDHEWRWENGLHHLKFTLCPPDVRQTIPDVPKRTGPFKFRGAWLVAFPSTNSDASP